jgi:hypothetical protein
MLKSKLILKLWHNSWGSSLEFESISIKGNLDTIVWLHKAVGGVPHLGVLLRYVSSPDTRIKGIRLKLKPMLFLEKKFAVKKKSSSSLITSFQTSGKRGRIIRTSRNT